MSDPMAKEVVGSDPMAKAVVGGTKGANPIHWTVQEMSPIRIRIATDEIVAWTQRYVITPTKGEHSIVRSLFFCHYQSTTSKWPSGILMVGARFREKGKSEAEWVADQWGPPAYLCHDPTTEDWTVAIQCVWQTDLDNCFGPLETLCSGLNLAHLQPIPLPRIRDQTL